MIDQDFVRNNFASWKDAKVKSFLHNAEEDDAAGISALTTSAQPLTDCSALQKSAVAMRSAAEKLQKQTSFAKMPQDLSEEIEKIAEERLKLYQQLLDNLKPET